MGKLCYTSLNYDEDAKKYPYTSTACDISKKYTLPDGQVVELGCERFQVPEVIFQPELIGREALGLADMVHEAVEDCSIDIRRKMYSNIVCAGGNTMFEN